MKNKTRSRRRPLRLESLEGRRLLAAYVVEASTPDDFGSALVSAIQKAEATPEPDVLTLPPGRYEIPSGVGSQPIVITSDIRLVGADPAKTEIVAPHNLRALDVSQSGQLSLEGLTVVGGHADAGGAIRNAGQLKMTDVSVLGGVADEGGLLFNSGQAFVINTVWTDGWARQGGAISNTGTLTIQSSALVGNHASNGYGGGAIMNSGTADIIDSLLTLNQSHVFGGAVSSEGALSIVDSYVYDNVSPNGGGVSIFEGTFDAQGDTIIAGNSKSWNETALVNDVAVYQRGTPGTLLSPELDAVGDQMAAKQAVSTWFTPSSTFPGYDDAASEMQIIATSENLAVAIAWSNTSEQFVLSEQAIPPKTTLPTLEKNLYTWSRIGPETIDLMGTPFDLEYRGYEAGLGASSNDFKADFLWKEITLVGVHSEAGAKAEIFTKTLLGVNGSSVRYTPLEGFVGTDRVTVTGTDRDGNTVTGAMLIEITNDVQTTIEAKQTESENGQIEFRVSVPDNAKVLVSHFDLVVSYDPAVVEPSTASKIGDGFSLLPNISVLEGGTAQESTIRFKGGANEVIEDHLATLSFDRIGSGDAAIRIRPEYGWQINSRVLGGLTPDVVDVAYVRGDTQEVIATDDSRFDVNNDNQVTALDSLIVINSLNRLGSDLGQSTGQGMREDVNGDGSITAIDALQVINYLNENRSQVRGEGESTIKPIDFNDRPSSHLERRITESGDTPELNVESADIAFASWDAFRGSRQRDASSQGQIFDQRADDERDLEEEISLLNHETVKSM